MKELLVLPEITRLQMLARRLEGEGIHTLIRNETVADGVYSGFLVPSFAPRLYVVDEADYDAARRFLEAWEKELDTPAEPEAPCPSCGEPVPGNFETCWSCGVSF